MRLPLIKVDDKEEKLRGCICGRDKSPTLYRTPELSPDKTNIFLGTIVILLVEIVVPIFFLRADIAILIPFVVLPIPVIIACLAVYRFASGFAFYDAKHLERVLDTFMPAIARAAQDWEGWRIEQRKQPAAPKRSPSEIDEARNEALRKIADKGIILEKANPNQ